MVGVFQNLLVSEQTDLFLLANGGVGVERDVDKIADAVVVKNNISGRLFSYFTSDIGVHLGINWIKLQKYEKKGLGKQIGRKSA